MNNAQRQSLVREDVMTVTWHGRAAEYRDLVSAVGRNCCCEYGMGARTRGAAHHMIAEDQRALDGLLFARRMADRLRREEWMAHASQAQLRAAHSAR
jgi:hypothetical protein